MKINLLYRNGSVWPWSMGQGFENALKELGHKVSIFISEKDSGHQINQYDDLCEFVKIPCDLFIAIGGGDKYCALYYNTPARKALMKLKIPKLAYFMEGMETRTLTKIKYEITVPLWTHILTCDETDVEDIKSLGCKNVAYTPGWVDEKVFYPKGLSIKHEFQFIGYIHKHRLPYVNFFGEKLGMVVGRYDSIEDYVNGINQTKILIGIPAVMKGFPLRVPETLACGKVLLHKEPPENFPLARQLFQDRKHIVFYKTMDEAVNIARFYSKHDDERKEIEKNAREEIIKKHTVLIRAKEFIDYATN